MSYQAALRGLMKHWVQTGSLRRTIVQKYEEGRSLRQIAKKYNVCVETIRQVLLRCCPNIIRSWEKRKKDSKAYTTVLTLNEEKKAIRYYKQGGSLEKIKKLFGVSYNTIRKVVHHYVPDSVRPPVIPPRNIKRQKHDLTHQKASLIGHLIGDGSVFKDRKGRYIIYYSNSCLKLVKSVLKALSSIYGLKPKIRKQGNSVFFIKCVSKRAWQDLSKYTAYGSREWKVPIEILQNANVLGPPFLRALADDEGCVILHPRRNNDWNRLVCLASISDQGRKGIIHLLSLLRIDSYEIGILIYISGRENLIRFQHVVGFTPSVKVSKGYWKGLGKLEVLKILSRSYNDPLFPQKFIVF